MDMPDNLDDHIITYSVFLLSYVSVRLFHRFFPRSRSTLWRWFSRQRA